MYSLCSGGVLIGPGWHAWLYFIWFLLADRSIGLMRKWTQWGVCSDLSFLEIVYRACIMWLALLDLWRTLQKRIIEFLCFPQQLNILSCSLGKILGFLIIRMFVIVDYHLHELLLGAVQHKHIRIRHSLAHLCIIFLTFKRAWISWTWWQN